MSMLRTLSLPPSLPLTRALITVLACSAMSCSVLIDTKTTQCSVDADCTNLGAAFADTTCQQNVCVKPPDTGPLGCVEAEPSPDPTVTLSFNISFTAKPAKPAPFAVWACGTLDSDCEPPADGPLMVEYDEAADPARGVHLPVPTGFQGSIRVDSPDGLPGQEFLGRPIVQDTQGYNLILPTPITVSFLIAATMEEYHPDEGIFVITTRDCARQPLAGVTVTNNVGGTGFYFQQQLPQKDRTDTSAEGAAGFVNVPAGLVSINATLAGREMTPTSAISRGGAVTYVEIFP